MLNDLPTDPSTYLAPDHTYGLLLLGIIVSATLYLHLTKKERNRK